ncbi:hypothetical protein C8Q69DRAFT_465605, partial [Paecilomyces variotii]
NPYWTNFLYYFSTRTILLTGTSLVCDWWHNAPQIFYLVEYYQPELPLSCNKVQLKPEYIFI